MQKKDRNFYNGKEYFIDKEKKVVILSKEFHNKLLNREFWNNSGFKKIGGSSLGDVLLTDSFKSQFAAFIRMSRLDMPILDPKYINAGKAIEPMVIDVLNSKLKGEKVEVFPPEKYNYDYFAGKDDVLLGIPDGYVRSKNLIVEIKTTQEKNYEQWNKYGVPLAYLKQAQLYSYLMGSPHFVIVATFLKEEDYLEPGKYPIKERKLKSYRYDVNVAQIEDDIQKIKEWYYKYTQLGISPEYNERLDADLLKYLECHNEQEWEQLKQQWKMEGKMKI